MRYIFVILAATILWIPNKLIATVIRVPQSQPTIQAGINAAVHGDTVLVDTGTYYERINYRAKRIVVTSVSGPGLTIIDASPFAGQDTASAVLFISGETIASVLDGFTLRNGHGTYANQYDLRQGGAVLCIQASATIRNCRMVNNLAYRGGGVYFEESNSIVENCLFDRDSAGNAGGAIYFWFGTLQIRNCVFSNNGADRGGGAVYGGLNGMLECNRSLFYKNRAANGGAIYCNAAYIDHCTIANNTATFGAGAGLFINSLTALTSNSIIYNNVGTEIYGSSTVRYSDIRGGWHGVGNINLNPAFVNPDSNNYTLASGSPCIDAGDPQSPRDPDNTVADMGAFYRDQSPATFVSPLLLSFGRVRLDVATTLPIRVTNIFNTLLHVRQMITTDPAFTLGTQTPFVLSPGESRQVQVNFTPSQRRNYHGSLIVMADEDTAIVVLDGEGSSIYAGNVWGTWRKNRSPFIVEDDVTIQYGDSLVIEPGVEIRLKPGKKFIVYGLLKAQGTSNDTIIFTRDHPVSGWWNLQLIGAHPSSELRFCRIEYGNPDDAIANNNNPYENGGGIYCFSSPVRITRCEISRNRTAPIWSFDGGRGGGIALFQNSDAVIESCLIADNVMSHGGGGIYSSNSNPVISHNTIIRNSAEGYAIYGSSSGGGIFVSGGTPQIRDNTITLNSTSAYQNNGGGIAIHGAASSKIERNIITNNRASLGGGVSSYQSSLILAGNRITNNTGPQNGGGVWCLSGQRVVMTKNVIAKNSVSGQGGGVWIQGPRSFIVNNTIAHNSVTYAGGSGGGIYIGASTIAEVRNNILFYNTATTSPQIQGTSTVIYCDVQDSIAGIGNISRNPAFADTSSYYLSVASPCVDAGDPAAFYLDFEDPARPGFALFPALGGLRNDMGAYGSSNIAGSIMTSVGEDVNSANAIPYRFVLNQNYPNPFNPSTEIRYQTPEVSRVTLKVFDVLGREVATLVNEVKEPGGYSITWNAIDLPSGVYFYRLTAGNFSATKKLVLLK